MEHGPKTRFPQPESLSDTVSSSSRLCCRYTPGRQVLLRTRPHPAPDVDHELFLNRYGTTLVTARHHRP